MSDWSELSTLGATCRPLAQPPIPLAGAYSSFRSSLTSTVTILALELRMLEASRIVLELDVAERQLRADGLPRSGAMPASPAVRISFESRHGPLRYATGEYRRWQDNLRAVALSMQALRAVDRHGVAKRGEQYVGWRQIERVSGSMSASTAEQVIERYGGDVRRALFATHPDNGGTTADFQVVQEARRVLGL